MKEGESMVMKDSNGKTIVIKDRVVIFDLEATCDNNDRLFPKEIIEIGAVDNLGREFNEFIKPIQRPVLTEFCKNLTTITQQDIDSARPFKEVYPEFMEFFKNATLISWGNYDKSQLVKDLDLNKMTDGRSYILTNHINLKELFHAKMGFFPRGMKSAMKQLGLKQEGTHHRGIDDAKNIKKIYHKLMQM